MNDRTRQPSIAAMLRRGLVLIAVLALAPAAAAERTLQSLESQTLPGEQVLLTFTLSGDAPEPRSFTVDQPARVAMDLPGTKLRVDKRYREIGVGAVRAVALAEGGDRTRVVIEMTQLVPHRIQVKGNQIQVRLGRQAAARTTEPKPARTAQPETETTEKPAGPRIEDVDFRRGETGAGRVILRVPSLSGPVDIQEEGGKIVARFPDAEVPEAHVQRLDVLDFATPVKYIDVMPRDGGARVVVTPKEGAEFEQLAYQTEDTYTIELQPLTPAEAEKRAKEDPKYTGERISLSFQNVDVRALLQIIADVADVNMVVSDTVSGTMALRLENVPWDQALDIILSSKGLGKRRDGNVIMVAPLEEIAAREQAELEAQQATTNLAPLRSEIIQVNYARAADLASLIQSGEISLLSERGHVTVDQRTNKLLVQDTREKLGEIRSLIERLDIPVRQVLIESRIVVANEDFSRDLGVSAGAAEGTDFVSSGELGDENIQGDFSVDLPISPAAGTLSTTIIGDDFNLELALSALQAEEKGEIISRPRVITADGQEAEINQGREIPFLEAASSGAATISFKDAELSLQVTPQITPDDRILMDLTVTQDAVGDPVNVQGGGQVPSIDTRSISTKILVDNGETVVLGGIFEEDRRTSSTKVPVLGDLPLLGFLFRSTQRTADKRELLIFISPRVISEELRSRR